MPTGVSGGDTSAETGIGIWGGAEAETGIGVWRGAEAATGEKEEDEEKREVGEKKKGRVEGAGMRRRKREERRMKMPTEITMGRLRSERKERAEEMAISASRTEREARVTENEQGGAGVKEDGGDGWLPYAVCRGRGRRCGQLPMLCARVSSGLPVK
jgi:hypothetical protein